MQTVVYIVYIAFCPQCGHKKPDKLDDSKNFQFKKGNRDRKVSQTPNSSLMKKEHEQVKIKRHGQ